ncbi:MAG: hypothetical protein IIC33_10920, partial [Chloroflexi bacterium]|nr:hypothetical protein [Chloroflexota bacterium]
TVEVYLDFDPEFLRVDSVILGPIFSQGGEWKQVLLNDVDNNTGRVSIAGSKGTPGMGGSDAQADFVLATLNVQIIAETPGTGITFDTETVVTRESTKAAYRGVAVTGVISDAVVSGISGTMEIQTGEVSISLEPQSVDGAIGFMLGITRVFDPTTNNDVDVVLADFQAQLTYPDLSGNSASPAGSRCINIQEVREMDLPFPIAAAIDNISGSVTINGSDPTGVQWPADLGHALTRLTGSALIPCSLTSEITDLTDLDGNSMPVVPPTLSLELLRGDARADGTINIADALFIAQYLVGLRPACTDVVDTGCLHSVNAASVRQDGSFDKKTIADALFIAQFLVGLRDESYSVVQGSPGSVTFDLNEENSSGQSGQATLTSQNDQTEVVLNLNPGTLETELVHIHSGQCGNSLGGVVHPLTSFVGGSGVSVTTVNAPLSSLLTGDFAINTHKKGSSGVFTACGNIPAAP